MDKKTIGKRLFGLRAQHRHSKQVLSRIVRCSVATLTSVESGQADDDRTERVGRCICAAYGADWAWISGESFPLLRRFCPWGLA